MAVTHEEISAKPLGDLLRDYPFIEAFFVNNAVDVRGREEAPLIELFSHLDEQELEDRALNRQALPGQLAEYINQMLSFLGEEKPIQSLTILPGTDKSGNPEGFEKLTIKTGQVVSIVGPTGSGKSRLLGDIEWVAQADTPTARRILIDGEVPDSSWRFSSSKKLVAQLSQNMNFVMDLTVREFLELHAESRMVQDRDRVVERIISGANDLAGEPFTPETPITSLSGGQSRALMIADTAILSRSPIILIDEIENAGIDRKRALALLLAEDKIVLMATHDPILALMGDRRIVIKNGGITKVVETSDAERAILSRLEELDRSLMGYRTRLRRGDSLIEEVEEGGK